MPTPPLRAGWPSEKPTRGKIPNKADPKFLEKVKKNVILKKKFEFNKSLFEKIDEKKFNDHEFVKLSKDADNIKTISLKTGNISKFLDNHG